MCAAALLLAFSSANAVMLRYEGTSVVGSDSILLSYFGGAATVLTASLDFEVSAGTPLTAVLSGGTGSVTWNDGVNRVFTISGLGFTGLVDDGTFSQGFTGFAPSIGGQRMTEFIFQSNLGVNPFTTGLELSDLLLSASITGSRAGILNFGSGTTFFRSFGPTTGDIARASSPVPEPTTAALLALGLLGAGFARKRRTH
jgi:hypothetical protein